MKNKTLITQALAEQRTDEKQLVEAAYLRGKIDGLQEAKLNI